MKGEVPRRSREKSNQGVGDFRFITFTIFFFFFQLLHFIIFFYTFFYPDLYPLPATHVACSRRSDSAVGSVAKLKKKKREVKSRGGTGEICGIPRTGYPRHLATLPMAPIFFLGRLENLSFFTEITVCWDTGFHKFRALGFLQFFLEHNLSEASESQTSCSSRMPYQGRGRG